MHSFSPTRALVVSIHDVSPLTERAARSILDQLAGLGVGQCSLLVVPDHHHRGHILANSDFCEWLGNQAKSGHEVVIHGYYHIRERKAAENPWQKLMTRAYTADEGEFYDIGETDASHLVTTAQDEFATLGLRPDGFIAPAWLLSEAGERALRKAGIRYTTRLRNVLSLDTGRLHESMSMVYSVRTGWRRATSLAWNASLYRRLKSNPLLRISIHPPDLEHKKIWAQILKYVALALEDREPMTYWNWVSSQPDLRSKPLPDHVQS